MVLEISLSGESPQKILFLEQIPFHDGMIAQFSMSLSSYQPDRVIFLKMEYLSLITQILHCGGA
jgi:hypothetical protein